MKALSPSLQAHLDSATTTLAWCWKLTRRDAVTFGFTDHDRDLVFDGTTYESATGFTASEIKDSLGLAVDNLDVASALSSSRLDENDLAAGLYDDAAVEIWRANWADTSQRVLMRKGSLGEVRRAGHVFSAEVRGLAHYLNQPKGRLYQYTCDARLGDTRCGVALSSATHSALATITTVTSLRLVAVTGLAAFSTDWFSRGLATFLSGANTGLAVEIRRHSKTSTATTLELWQQLPRMPTVGDTLTVTAGCDKHFRTCREKFNNASAFRGFPHMPGNDLLTSPARAGDLHDGAALR
jgi:uncharacterized phage protein (TIGR02218 family)